MRERQIVEMKSLLFLKVQSSTVEEDLNFHCLAFENLPHEQCARDSFLLPFSLQNMTHSTQWKRNEGFLATLIEIAICATIGGLPTTLKDKMYNDIYVDNFRQFVKFHCDRSLLTVTLRMEILLSFLNFHVFCTLYIYNYKAISSRI